MDPTHGRGPEGNLQDLQASLQREGARWQAGDTAESKLPSEDKRKLLGLVWPPDAPSLAELEARASQQRPRPGPIIAGSADVPARFDLRDVKGQSYVTPPRFQGASDACVAFAANAALESTILMQANDPGRSIELSDAQLYYCYGPGKKNEGWWPPKALEALKKGVTDSGTYPFFPGFGQCSSCESLPRDWNLTSTRLTGWHEIEKGDPSKIKEWIRTRGPVITPMIVYWDFYFYIRGVYHHEDTKEKPNHAVCLIGYDDNENAWIAKNSWSSLWGERGYFRIAYGACLVGTQAWAVDGGAQNLLTLDEHAIGTPACLNVDDKHVEMAWTGMDGRLNLMVLKDEPLNKDGKVTLDESSSDGPVLIRKPGGFKYMAWVGGDRHLNVMSYTYDFKTDSKAYDFKRIDKTTLDETASGAPALLFAKNRFFLAWTGRDDRLNVMASDDGKTWKDKVTLEERSSAAPSLATVGDKLYLVWRGTNTQHNINWLYSSDGKNWTGKFTSDETCSHRPEILDGQTALDIAWIGRDHYWSVNVQGPLTSGSATTKRTFKFNGSNTAGPRLFRFKGHTYVAWGSYYTLDAVQTGPIKVLRIEPPA